MTNSSGITPLDVKVLVRPDPVEEKTKGGIILADSIKDQNKYATCSGRLIAAGPNAFAEWGEGRGPQPGARVLFAQYAGLRRKGEDGEDYLVCNDEDMIGILAEEAQ
jgi:chaperonin GroES